MRLLQASHRAGPFRGTERHREPQADRDGDEHQGDDAKGAARDPKPVLTRVGVGVHAAITAPPAPELSARGPISSTVPSSRTIRPPGEARTSRAPLGPERNAILARVSASRAVAPREVAWITPVQAGLPVEGSSRWCAKPDPLDSDLQRRVLIPLVATAPRSSRKACANPSRRG